MKIVFSWTNTREIEIDCFENQTLRFLLEENRILLPEYTTRLFYQGRELPLDLSVGYFTRRDRVKVIIYQKKLKQIADPNLLYFNQKFSKQRQMELASEEYARMTDNFFNRIAMQRKLELQFQESVEKAKRKESLDFESQATITNYESKISEAPLPLCFPPVFNLHKQPANQNDNIIENIVIHKSSNDDTSQL